MSFLQSVVDGISALVSPAKGERAVEPTVTRSRQEKSKSRLREDTGKKDVPPGIARSKKRFSDQELEKQYFGDYTAGADAIPICTPSYNACDDWRPPGSQVKITSEVDLSKVMPPFRPLDTLNKPTVHSRTAGRRNDHANQNAASRRTNGVYLNKSLPFDIEDDIQSTTPAKRRRIDDRPQQKISHVDSSVSDLESQSNDVHAVTKQSRRDSSPSQDSNARRSSATNERFKNNESKSVYNRLSGSSKPRKPMSSSPEDRRSIHRRSETPEHLRSDSNIRSNDKRSSRDDAHAVATSAIKSRPTINLTKGLPELSKPRHRELDQDNLDRRKGGVPSERPISNGDMNEGAVASNRENVSSQRRPAATAMSRLLGPGVFSGVENMKTQYIRARDRMQPASEQQVKPKAISDSEDELATGKTVGNIRTDQSRHLSATSRNDREASPDALRPTNFGGTRSSELASSSVRKTEPALKGAFIEDQLGGLRIRNLYTATKVLLSNGIELRYDKMNNRILVYDDGEIVTNNNSEKVFSITANEIHKVRFAENSELVELQGVSGGISTGKICIALHKPRDFTWLSNTIAAMDASAVFKDEGYKRMNGIYSNSTNGLIELVKRSRKLAIATTLAATQGSTNIQVSPVPAERRAAYKPVPETLSPYFSTRRSTRQPKPITFVEERSPSPEKWTKINRLTPWSHPVVYPTQGVKRVNVDFQDLERLDEGEFLNDNIISFAMRFIEEKMSPQHREKVHFFNSFFFTALSNKNGKRAFNYEAVQRWTKNKDLFDVPYIVVPINLDMHWFVAIICNLPSITRKMADSDVEEAPPESEDELAKLKAASDRLEIDLDNPPVQVDSQDSSSSMLLDIADISKAEKPAPSPGRKGKLKRRPSLRKYDVNAPVIITLDSFGSARTTEIRYLKEYIVAEAENKRNIALDVKDLDGVTAKGLPLQPNFCDCGVYLVGYMEAFAADPRAFVKKILSRELDEDADFTDFSSSQKRAQLRQTLLDLAEEQEHERKVTKAKKTMEKHKNAGKVDETPSSPVMASSQPLPASPTPRPPRPAPISPPALARHRSPQKTVQMATSRSPWIEDTDMADESGEEDDHLREYTASKPLASGSKSLHVGQIEQDLSTGDQEEHESDVDEIACDAGDRRDVIQLPSSRTIGRSSSSPVKRAADRYG